MLEVRRLDSWTTGETWALTAPKIHQFFVGQKILDPKFCWTERRTVNILRHVTSMGNWVKVAMWPCGLLREADKLLNGYRGDTAEGLMDPLAKATCHISIRSVLVFFGSLVGPRYTNRCLKIHFRSHFRGHFFDMKQIGNQWELQWCKKSKCEFWDYLRPLSLFQLLYVTLSSQRHLAWWTKAKNGLCICMGRISNWPCAKRTWRVVQNGFLVWNVFWFFQLIQRMAKLRPHRWPKSTWKKGKEISSHQHFLQKRGKNLLLEDLHRFLFFFRYIIPCQESPQIQRKDVFFFLAEAWNSADLLMMKAGKNFIAWKSFVWKFLCWTFLFLQFFTFRKSWPSKSL